MRRDTFLKEIFLKTKIIIFILKMPRGNFRARRAVTTQKVRRQWNVREKLMVVFYHENGYSVRETANKYGIQPKQVRD